MNETMTEQKGEAVPSAPKRSDLQSVEVAISDLEHELCRIRANAEDLLQMLKHGSDPRPETVARAEEKRERGETRLEEMYIVLSHDCLKEICVDIEQTMKDMMQRIQQEKQ